MSETIHAIAMLAMFGGGGLLVLLLLFRRDKQSDKAWTDDITKRREQGERLRAKFGQPAYSWHVFRHGGALMTDLHVIVDDLDARLAKLEKQASE